MLKRLGHFTARSRCFPIVVWLLRLDYDVPSEIRTRFPNILPPPAPAFRQSPRSLASAGAWSVGGPLLQTRAEIDRRARGRILTSEVLVNRPRSVLLVLLLASFTGALAREPGFAEFDVRTDSPQYFPDIVT